MVVTHDKALAKRANRMVEIRDGVVVEDRPTSESELGIRN